MKDEAQIDGYLGTPLKKARLGLEQPRRSKMRRLMTIAAAVASIAGSAEIGGSAQAGAMPNAGVGMAANGALPFEKVQYYGGGYQYCWGNGWHGPGWYRCGYPWRSGYGWGGGYGWQGRSVGGGYRFPSGNDNDYGGHARHSHRDWR